MIVSMKSVRPFGISGRVGLALLVAWPALTIGLSATGERLILIYVVALLGILPALFGAVTWLRAGQRHPKVFFQKRLITLLCALTALSVPFTHWPLRLALVSSIPVCDYFLRQPRFISDCWLGVIRAKYVSFGENGEHNATLRSGVNIKFFHKRGGGISLRSVSQPDNYHSGE